MKLDIFKIIFLSFYVRILYKVVNTHELELHRDHSFYSHNYLNHH